MSRLVPITLICLAIALFCDLFSRHNEMLTKYVYKEKFIWLLLPLALCIFFGMRTRYNDTTTYIESYIYLTNSNFDFSDVEWTFGSYPAFYVLSILMKSIGFSTHAYIMAFAIFTYTTFIWFINKYSSDFLMSIFLFICFVMTFPAAAIKQCTAIAIGLIAVDKAFNNKWLAFAFFVFVAMTFHGYSFLFFIVPLLMFVPWQDKKTYFWVLLFFGAGFALRPLLGAVIKVTTMVGSDYTVSSFTEEGVNPFRVLVCLVPLVMSFLLRRKINNPCYEIGKEDSLFINLSMLNGGVMFVALFGTANYFARLANYFCLFPIIALPRLFNMVSTKWRIPLKVAAVSCYLIFFWYDSTHSGYMFDLVFDRDPIKDFTLFTDWNA